MTQNPQTCVLLLWPSWWEYAINGNLFLKNWHILFKPLIQSRHVNNSYPNSVQTVFKHLISRNIESLFLIIEGLLKWLCNHILINTCSKENHTKSSNREEHSWNSFISFLCLNTENSVSELILNLKWHGGTIWVANKLSTYRLPMLMIWFITLQIKFWKWKQLPFLNLWWIYHKFNP